MKRAIAIFAFLAAALVAFTAPADAFTQAQINACTASNPAVIQACTQLLSGNLSNKDRAAAFNNRGFAYFRNGELNSAIADLSRAIELAPNAVQPLNIRGAAYSAKGEQERAIADFNRAIELAPTYAYAFNNRGDAYSKKGEAARAISDYTRAIELNPKYDRAFNNRGLAYSNKGEQDLAIADFTRAIDLDPKFAVAFYNRGLAYGRKGEQDRAITDYTRAIELDPKFHNPYSHRGYAYLKQGKLGPARADIEKALELKPDYEDAKTALAELKQAEAAKKAEAEKPRPQQQAKVEEPKPAEAKPITPAVPVGKRLALVIGNANYRHTPALANPRNDAADMAAALKRLGFEVIFEQDLDKRAMDDAFRRFAREVRGADAALFYYAGHAMQFEGVNYLMPVDAKLADEADVAYEMAKLDDIVADMARMNGVRIAVLDACRNNPLEEKLKRSISLTRGVAPQRGLARVARPEGLVVAYSTQAGNVAEDGKGRNSPFTAALLTHIETPGLEVGPLFRRVMGSVVEKTGGKQHPELSVLFSGEFYFKPGS